VVIFEGGELVSITNKASKATTTMSVQWGWYNSSVGGCTPYGDVPKDLQVVSEETNFLIATSKS